MTSTESAIRTISCKHFKNHLHRQALCSPFDPVYAFVGRCRRNLGISDFCSVRRSCCFTYCVFYLSLPSKMMLPLPSCPASILCSCVYCLVQRTQWLKRSLRLQVLCFHDYQNEKTVVETLNIHSATLLTLMSFNEIRFSDIRVSAYSDVKDWNLDTTSPKAARFVGTS